MKKGLRSENRGGRTAAIKLKTLEKGGGGRASPLTPRAVEGRRGDLGDLVLGKIVFVGKGKDPPARGRKKEAF